MSGRIESLPNDEIQFGIHGKGLVSRLEFNTDIDAVRDLVCLGYKLLISSECSILFTAAR